MKGPGRVDLMSGVGILEGSRNGWQGGEVEDMTDALDGPATGVDGQEVTFDEVDVIEKVDEVIAVARGEVVEYADPVSPFEQRPDDVTADKTGSAGHEIRCSHVPSCGRRVKKPDEGSLRAHPKRRTKDSANDEHYKLEMR